jgi:hypothetical protein
MPYINPNRRRDIDGGEDPLSVGELTYLLTRTVLNYLPPKPRFQDFAEVLGALVATERELYRRVVGPYEDKKCEENGDVY